MLGDYYAGRDSDLASSSAFEVSLLADAVTDAAGDCGYASMTSGDILEPSFAEIPFHKGWSKVNLSLRPFGRNGASIEVCIPSQRIGLASMRAENLPLHLLMDWVADSITGAHCDKVCFLSGTDLAPFDLALAIGAIPPRTAFMSVSGNEEILLGLRNRLPVLRDFSEAAPCGWMRELVPDGDGFVFDARLAPDAMSSLLRMGTGQMVETVLPEIWVLDETDGSYPVGHALPSCISPHGTEVLRKLGFDSVWGEGAHLDESVISAACEEGLHDFDSIRLGDGEQQATLETVCKSAALLARDVSDVWRYHMIGSDVYDAPCYRDGWNTPFEIGYWGADTVPSEESMRAEMHACISKGMETGLYRIGMGIIDGTVKVEDELAKIPICRR